MRPAASILVVDDQPALLENVAFLLATVGYQVLTARDGIEALDLLQAQAADLILSDVVMPRLDGYQLYERVRQNPAWVSIPFMFLTAYPLDSNIRPAKELGTGDFLTKPVQPEDLLAAVQDKLRSARQVARST